MATTKAKDERKRKRKRKEEESNVEKRAKVDDESNYQQGEEDEQAKIVLLGKEILESKKNYNNITALIRLAEDFERGNVETAMLANVVLCRIFGNLLEAGGLTYKRSLSEKEAVRVEWLKARLADFKSILISLLLRDDDLASTALTLAMKVLQAEGEHLQDKEFYVFPKAFLEQIVRALIKTENTDAPSEFLQKFVDEYDDIRYFTHQAIKNIVSDWPKDSRDNECFEQIFDLMAAIDGVPGSNEELEDFYIPRPTKKSHGLLSLAKHKTQAQEAWIALMSLRLDKSQQKRILNILTTVIAPWFATLELLSDFLADCYNSGGAISLLALSGVFYLIQHRNLDYPSFYTKLYSLLDRDVLHSKHRSNFFRLLDTFLASSHLPAALVASFIKRLSRLSLNAPPGAIVFVVPWIYNLLKRHPPCTFMIHREVRTPEQKRQIDGEGFRDPFDPEEADPMATGAADSCLWELVQLQSHYHPNVATIAKIISEQFTKPQYNIEDFLDHSYASFLEAEMSKEVKKAPAVEFHIPKRVFLAQDEGTDAPDSLVVKLWDFS